MATAAVLGLQAQGSVPLTSSNLPTPSGTPPYKPKADGLCPTPHKKYRALALPLSRAAGAVRTDKRAPLRGWAALADQGGSPQQPRGRRRLRRTHSGAAGGISGGRGACRH